MNRLKKLYIFRPFEIQEVNYRSYKGRQGEGIIKSPKGRSGHRIVCNDTDIYSFGGFNPDLGDIRTHAGISYMLQELLRYNILTKRWYWVYGPKTEGMPEELASSSMAIKDDIILVYGGTGYPFGITCSNKCFIMCPKNMRNPLMMETNGDPPCKFYGQAIAINGRYLYTVGGTNGFEYFCDIYRLDLVTKTWKCLCINRNDIREDPDGRYRHEVALDEHYIYVFGGGTTDTAFDLQSVPAFHLPTNEWHHLKTQHDPLAPSPGYPEPRKCHSIVQNNTVNGIEVVIVGGFLDNDLFYNDIWKLNLNTLRWQLLSARLPYPLYFHAAASSGDGPMYIFGGIEVRRDFVRTNRVFKMWTTIPKLTEIAWEAIVHYDSSIIKSSLETLLEIGIPKKFADRVVVSQSSAAEIEF